MCPSGSEAKSGGGGQGGFTLLEVLVTLAVGSILLWGLTRFYQDSSRSYELQAQTAERDQNAHFTIKWLTEALQQAGASLPDSGFPVITLTGSPAVALTLGTNPRGSIVFISTSGPGDLTRIPVGDTALFAKAAYVLVDYANPARATFKGTIAGLKKGIAGALDTVKLAAGLPFALSVGDMIYAYQEDSYSLSGGNLVLNGMVLAENIDSLRFYFYDAAKNPTTTWTRMRSAKVQVTARTPSPDPRLPGDGYRKISLSMNVFLRSRV